MSSAGTGSCSSETLRAPSCSPAPEQSWIGRTGLPNTVGNTNIWMEIIWKKNRIYSRGVWKARLRPTREMTTLPHDEAFLPIRDFQKWSQAACVIQVKGLGVFEEGHSTVLAGWGWRRHCFILSGCCYLSIQRFQIPAFHFSYPKELHLDSPKCSIQVHKLVRKTTWGICMQLDYERLKFEYTVQSIHR